jgi:hypothetical protein
MSTVFAFLHTLHTSVNLWMPGCLVLFNAVAVINWIYQLEKEGMQLQKDSFICKSICYITLYSTLTLSYSIVTPARTVAYTKNNILSAIEATGIWCLNPRKVFLRQSRNISQFESPPVTSTPLLSATPRLPRGVCWLAHSALHLVTRQSPSSLKIKPVVAHRGRSAWGALADMVFGDEILRTFRLRAKNTNLVAAKDCHHLGKARVYTAENVV